MSQALYLEPNGCVSKAGFQALYEAPPGQGPPEVMRHSAGCARCQTAALMEATGGTARRRTAVDAKRIRKLAWVFLTVMLMFLISLVVLTRSLR
jgi:hypothetical protein